MSPSSLPSSLPGPGGTACWFDTASADFYAWGSVNSDGKTQATPQTRFPIASITKTFTAHLLLECIRDHRLSLQTRLQDLLPGFALADPAASREMTLEDALCHHSGLPPHTWAWVYGDVDRPAFIRERLPFLASAGPHRAAHRYSNILYAVLGQVIETLTGTSWEQTLQEKLLTPLEMSDTACLTETWAATDPAPAPPHDARCQPIPPFFAKTNHLIAPASEIISTAADLARWGQVMLGLPRGTDRWRVRNQVPGPRPLPGMGPLGYALGWRVEHIANRLRVWHSGQCSGYSTLLTLYPEQGRGGVYLANRSDAVPALHALDLAGPRILKTLDLQESPAPPAPSAPADPLPSQAPADTEFLPEGLYGNPGYGTLRIEHRKKVAYLIYQTAPPAPLLRDSSGTYSFQPPGYTCRFKVEPDVKALRIFFDSGTPPVLFHQNGIG